MNTPLRQLANPPPDVKKLLRIIFISSLFIIPISLITGLFWVVSDQQKNSSWLLTQHFNPINSTVFLSVASADNSWAIRLASEDFSKISESKKESLAKVTAEEAWNLVGKDQGYNKSQLENWFLDTAKHYSSYPIIEKTLTNGLLRYRDLSSSNIPKPNKYIAVIRALFSEPHILQLIFWLGLCIVISLYIIIGTFGLFISKQIPFFFKILAFTLLLIILLEGWIIKMAGKQEQRVIGENFHVYTVRENYLSAKGTWRGVSEKIANPGNAALIECFRDEGICRESIAELSDNSLMLNSTVWNIKSWDEKEVVIDEENSCNTIKMVINHKDKAVTQIRTPKEPLPADCAIGGTKFITELVDGFDVAFPKRK